VSWPSTLCACGTIHPQLSLSLFLINNQGWLLLCFVKWHSPELLIYSVLLKRVCILLKWCFLAFCGYCIFALPIFCISSWYQICVILWKWGLMFALDLSVPENHERWDAAVCGECWGYYFFSHKKSVTANSVYISLFRDLSNKFRPVMATVSFLYKNLNTAGLLYRKGKAFHFTMG
jgi:hypothetical protein